MSTEPLPVLLDVRQAAVRGFGVSGVIPIPDLKRFRPLLAGDEGQISAVIGFSRDEDRRYLMHVRVEAQVLVTCQRCLESMAAQVASESLLAIVWTDEEAVQIPRHLDPLVVGEAPSRLWDVVEEELILALPAFTYHAAEECNVQRVDFSDVESQGDVVEKRSNPFNILGQIEPGK